jgi:hypothetical protein
MPILEAYRDRFGQNLPETGKKSFLRHMIENKSLLYKNILKYQHEISSFCQRSRAKLTKKTNIQVRQTAPHPGERENPAHRRENISHPCYPVGYPHLNGFGFRILLLDKNLFIEDNEQNKTP